MATNIIMPKLGESVTEGTIGKWLKQKGDPIAMYEPVVEVITDKVNSEIPAPAAGMLLAVLVPEGATVNVGTLIALIGQAGETVETPNLQTTLQPPTSNPQLANDAATSKLAVVQATTRLSPVVARLAAEHNVDVTQIKGTGEGGRVTKKDIEAFIAQRDLTPRPSLLKGEGARAPAPIPASQPRPQPMLQPAPVVTLPTTQPPIYSTTQPMADEELVPLTPMRKAIAEHMVRSVQTSPHVTTVFEVDMSKVVAQRNARKEEFARQGADLTYTAYFAEVVARVLREQPRVNSSFSEQGLVLKKAVNLGIAAALEDGLIVPVLKNADELNLLGLARGINDLAKRAREQRLKPDDVQGGTFTLTNLGGSGALFGTPIINQPQVAIMGVGSIAKRAVVLDDAIAIRPMVYLSLSFDHRALDGADGDRFLGAVKQYLENYA